MNENKLNLTSYDAINDEAYTKLKLVVDDLEPYYAIDFSNRAENLLSSKLLQKIHVFSVENVVVGMRLIVTSNNKIFRKGNIVTRSTMFRMCRSFRKKGLGKKCFILSTKKAFEDLPINRLYGATSEFGALKLYSRIEGVKIPKKQFVNKLEVNEKFMKLDYPNSFKMSNDVVFYVDKNPYYSRK